MLFKMLPPLPDCNSMPLPLWEEPLEFTIVGCTVAALPAETMPLPLEVAVALLADMKKQAQDHGAEFLVTINIPRNQVDEADWDKLRNQYHLDKESSMAYQINEVLSQMTNESGVTFYDPRLDATNWKEDKGILHFPVDGHFNQNGHIFMGEKVADFILSNNLVE